MVWQTGVIKHVGTRRRALMTKPKKTDDESKITEKDGLTALVSRSGIYNLLYRYFK